MLDTKLATDIVLGLQAGSAGSRSACFMQDGIVAVLDRIDQDAVEQEILALLTDLFGEESVFAAVEQQIDAGGNVLALAYALLDTCDASTASQLLAKAPAYEFRFSTDANPRGQATAFVDAAMNAILVSAAVGGLKRAIADKVITDESCRSIADELSSRNSTQLVNPVFIAAVEQVALDLHERLPGRTIYCLSIGCGRGNNDVELYRAVMDRHPGIDLKIVGFDRYQVIESNPIGTICGGMIINRELDEGETYIEAIRREFGEDDPAVVATERYALHHMHRTTETLLADLEGVALVSVDHPISKQQRLDLGQRTAMIAYDLLSAQVRTARFGGTWVAAAMADSKVFNILYRREEDMVEQQKHGVIVAAVEGKTPPTWIITYPAGFKS